MSIFSISDIACLTGIQKHTLRIWEKRYDIVQPKRTATNIRYYDEQDLKRLLNIVTLLINGFRISQAAALSCDELNKEVCDCVAAKYCSHLVVKALYDAAQKLDDTVFEQVLDENIAEIGLESTMLEMVFPFMEKLNLMCQAEQLKNVHRQFSFHLIQKKLINIICCLPENKKDYSKRFLLFLSSREKQEITLLFINYLLKSRGFQVMYLGSNLVCEDVKVAYVNYKPDYVFIDLSTQASDKESVDLIHRLFGHMENLRLIILSPIHKMFRKNLHIFNKNLHIFNEINAMVCFINKMDVQLVVA